MSQQTAPIVAEYVSVWDDCDEMRTRCKVDLSKSPPLAFDVDWDEEPDDRPDICTAEYIELPAGYSPSVLRTFVTEDGRRIIDGELDPETIT